MIDYEQYSNLFHESWSIHREEKPTWDYMKTLLSEDCVFFDIGCQKGIFSEGVFQCFGDGCNVHAFDVLKHPSIDSLISKYKNFHFTNSAVANGEIIDCMIQYNSNIFVNDQQSIRIDDYCRENEITRIDFIKIDVDGPEKKVLEGSLNTLKKYSPKLMVEMVISESDHNRLRISRENTKECFDILNSVGYKMTEIRNGMNYFFEKNE